MRWSALFPATSRVARGDASAVPECSEVASNSPRISMFPFICPCSEEARWSEGNQRGENQVKRNEAEKRRYYLSPGNPLALKSAQANLTLRAASRTLLKFKS